MEKMAILSGILDSLNSDYIDIKNNTLYFVDRKNTQLKTIPIKEGKTEYKIIWDGRLFDYAKISNHHIEIFGSHAIDEDIKIITYRKNGEDKEFTYEKETGEARYKININNNQLKIMYNDYHNIEHAYYEKGETTLKNISHFKKVMEEFMDENSILYSVIEKEMPILQEFTDAVGIKEKGKFQKIKK